MTEKETDQKLHYAETLMAMIKETFVNNVDLHCDPDDPCGICRDCLIKKLGEVATPHLATTYASKCYGELQMRRQIGHLIKNRAANS